MATTSRPVETKTAMKNTQNPNLDPARNVRPNLGNSTLFPVDPAAPGHVPPLPPLPDPTPAPASPAPATSAQARPDPQMLTPQQLLQNHLGLVQAISQPYVLRNFRYSWAERGRQEPREPLATTWVCPECSAGFELFVVSEDQRRQQEAQNERVVLEIAVHHGGAMRLLVQSAQCAACQVLWRA